MLSPLVVVMNTSARSTPALLKNVFVDSVARYPGAVKIIAQAEKRLRVLVNNHDRVTLRAVVRGEQGTHSAAADDYHVHKAAPVSSPGRQAKD